MSPAGDDGRADDASGTRPGAAPADAVLTGRGSWIAALRQALCAPARGASAGNTPADGTLTDGTPAERRLLLWSPDFAEWPLDEAAVLDALAHRLRAPGQQLVFIARDVEALARRHPRLTRWRRDWSHRIEAWTPTAPIEAEPAGLLLSGLQAVQLLDAVHWRTRLVSHAPLVRAWWEQCDASLQRCAPAWPVTTLGL